MKLAYVAALPVVLAAPASLGRRESSTEMTDRYLFSTALPKFLQSRTQRSPKTLDWSSDGCSNAPDNPFGFPFEPACERHDFGYRNYKAQHRFDYDARYRLDSNFGADMEYQCESVSARRSCRGLATVYYYAVRMFGGFVRRDEDGPEVPGDSSQESAEDLIASYYKAMQEYRQAVKVDQADGLLPDLQRGAPVAQGNMCT